VNHLHIKKVAHNRLPSVKALKSNLMFSLFRTKCSLISMTDKYKKKLNTTQSHMHTQTPKVMNTPIHQHTDATVEKTILITNRQTSS